MHKSRLIPMGMLKLSGQNHPHIPCWGLARNIITLNMPATRWGLTQEFLMSAYMMWEFMDMQPLQIQEIQVVP